MLKEENKRLQLENSELRDLCCYLDTDRQKAKHLSREWQRFGRYTSGVMKQEVGAYQEKLRELEQRQETLVTENAELKEICVYLDEQRTGGGGARSCVGCGAKLPPSPSTPPQDRDVSRDEADAASGSGRSSDSENHKPEADRKDRIDDKNPLLDTRAKSSPFQASVYSVEKATKKRQELMMNFLKKDQEVANVSRADDGDGGDDIDSAPRGVAIIPSALNRTGRNDNFQVSPARIEMDTKDDDEKLLQFPSIASISQSRLTPKGDGRTPTKEETTKRGK